MGTVKISLHANCSQHHNWRWHTHQEEVAAVETVEDEADLAVDVAAIEADEAVSREVVAEEVKAIAEAVVVVEEAHLEEAVVHQEDVEELEQREAQRLSLNPIVTLVSSSPVVRKICWSPRTFPLASQSTARSASASRTPAQQTQTELQVSPRSNTVSGILSEVSWLPVSWVVWTRSSSSLEPRSFTSVLPPEPPFLTTLISLVLPEPSLLLNSPTALVAI